MNSAGSNSRVLLVADHAISLVLLKSLVEGKGYHVTSVTNELAALTLLRLGLDPCLILIDLGSEFTDGTVLMTRLAEDPKLLDIPVVTLVQLQLVAHHLQALPQPESIEGLLAAIEHYCEPGSGVRG